MLEPAPRAPLPLLPGEHRRPPLRRTGPDTHISPPPDTPRSSRGAGLSPPRQPLPSHAPPSAMLEPKLLPSPRLTGTHRGASGGGRGGRRPRRSNQRRHPPPYGPGRLARSSTRQAGSAPPPPRRLPPPFIRSAFLPPSGEPQPGASGDSARERLPSAGTGIQRACKGIRWIETFGTPLNQIERSEEHSFVALLL